MCFQASPDNATGQQKRDFQTEVLLSTMEIFHVMSGGNTQACRGESGGLLLVVYDTKLLMAEQETQHAHQPLPPAPQRSVRAGIRSREKQPSICTSVPPSP